MYNSYSLNYAPYAMQNLFDGTHFPSAIKNDSIAYAFWCRALYQRICSVVEFDLPDNWNRARDFFEACLFGRGFVCVFDSKEFGLSFQPCTLYGYDFYYQPTQAIVTNPKLSKTFDIGKDCSLIKLTNDYSGVVDIIAYYAEKLATMDGALNMSIINSKFAYILGAKNKAAGNAIKMIFDKVNKGETTIVYDKSITEGLGGEDSIEFIDRAGLKNSYLVTDLLNDMENIIKEFDNEIGIPTMPPEKRERMISSEVEARDADTNARITLWNECLTNSIKEVNEMFKTDIGFKFKFINDNPVNTEDQEGMKWALQSLQWQG